MKGVVSSLFTVWFWHFDGCMPILLTDVFNLANLASILSLQDARLTVSSMRRSMWISSSQPLGPYVFMASIVGSL